MVARLMSVVPEAAKRLPEYSVERLALKGAPVMVTAPRVVPSVAVAVTLTSAAHSSELERPKMLRTRLPEVPAKDAGTAMVRS